MSTLVITELSKKLTQEIRYNQNERCHIAAIIPYLYIHNMPSGNFTLSLLRENTLIASKNFNCVDIQQSLNTDDNYMHVFYPIILDRPVQIDSGLYKITLTSTDYVFKKGSFIGWCQQFENEQSELDYITEDDSKNPFAIRFKTYKEGINNV